MDDFVRVFGGSPQEGKCQIDLPKDIVNGHPYLSPGREEKVTFVYEDEPSSIIAYSLRSSTYYDEVRSQKLRILNQSSIDEIESLHQDTGILLKSTEKHHVKHKFSDICEAKKVSGSCNFSCTSYFALQVSIF